MTKTFDTKCPNCLDYESCPVCGFDMEVDPDGAWCPKCEDYWMKDALRDYHEGYD